MPQSISNINGQVPTFRGLTARSIPENPDVQRETLRLLLQFSAFSSQSRSSELKPLSNTKARDVRQREASQSEGSQSSEPTLLPLLPHSSSQSTFASQPRVAPSPKWDTHRSLPYTGRSFLRHLPGPGQSRDAFKPEEASCDPKCKQERCVGDTLVSNPASP